MERVGFLENAATRAGGAAVSTRNAIARAAVDIDWERIYSRAKAISHNAAGSARTAHAHAKGIFLSTKWGQVRPETAQMLKNGLGTLLVGIMNNATDSMTAADENATKKLGGCILASLHNHENYLGPTGIVAGAVVGGTLMIPVLGVIGLSSIGPVAGSFAASLQYAGYVGTVFSTAQSVAVGGYGVTAATTCFSTIGCRSGRNHWATTGASIRHEADDKQSDAAGEGRRC